ncbi:MAG: glycosyltransferase family 39 protein, partial [Chloroflexota bacterium]|nr:glycosyltransferase family 39 protein [Chloroflexota bacterium]
MANADLPLNEPRISGSGARRPGVRWLLVAAITLLAAFLRLYRIDSLPPGDGYDPAYYGVDALQFLRGTPPSVMLPPNREPLFSYLVTGSFLLFGVSTASIHLTSTLVGILTIPLTCLAADALFASQDEPLTRWGGPLAALMIAVSYWHLNWSRYGVRAILVPLFAAATIWFLWRGLQTGALRWFLLCGGALGLSMYTYQAARLLPILVAVGFASSVWERGAIARRDWNHFILVAGIALLIFAPLGLHFATHPGSFSHRIEEALVVEAERPATSNARAVLNQALDAVLAFSFTG